MVTIGMNYAVLNGKEAIFENAFNKVVKAMTDMAGHSETHLYRDINDPQQYLIVSQWSDKSKFDAFIASETFRNVANWGKEQILSGRPRHEVYGDVGSSGVCPAGAK
jgi:heme-degrading monooxygenase HmoA